MQDRACSTVLAAIIVIAISSPASAGVYLGLGVGTKPVVNDAMADVSVPSGRSVRGLVGLRFANVAVEGAVNGFDVVTQRSGNQTVYQASAALKLSIPVVSHIEGFGRAGLERTWLNLDDDRYNLRGDGFLAGAGIELRLNAVIASMSVFVDYTVHHTSLESMVGKVDSTSQVLGVGVTVGL
jgi:hypothetical protein